MFDIAPRTLNIAGAQTARASRSAAYVFSVGKHTRLCGSPYENKRPPFGGLLFWQGHKGSNSGHAVLETAALPTELYPFNKIYYITFGATCQDVFSKFFIFPENFRDVS